MKPGALNTVTGDCSSSWAAVVSTALCPPQEMRRRPRVVHCWHSVTGHVGKSVDVSKF